MLEPPLPRDEGIRVDALRSLEILDTPPEERFDRVTRIAAQTFNVPIVLVSLVDADRQWFKSCVGLSVRETPRSISFCGHAILGETLMEVPDTRSDPRFADNPLVTGEPGIRFYAGQPLTDADGRRLGTLCLIDRRPRTLIPSERQILLDLSRIVSDELAHISLNRTTAKLGRRQAELQSFLENAHDLIQSVTPEGRFTFVNPAWQNALGYSDDDVSRLSLFDIIHPDSRAHCVSAFHRVLAGQSVSDIEATFVAKDGRQIHVQGNAACRIRPDGVCITQSIFRDVTERKLAEFALQEAYRDMEQRVAERTAELSDAYKALRSETDARAKSEALREGRNLVLEKVATGRSDGDVLDSLVLVLEQLIPGMKGSILLMDERCERLLHGAAPNLPRAYNEAIHGARIGPARGSCGTAAFENRVVIVTDIQTASVNKQSFDAWIRPLTLVSQGESEAVFAVPNKFFVDWINEHYAGAIRDNLRRPALEGL